VNPACSKCRAATAYFDEAGIEYTVRRYLDEPPTAEELTVVLDRLGLEPWDLARTGEAVAKEIGLADLPRDVEHRDRWVEAMVEHPILIQRPILTADDGTTVVGRDPESLDAAVRAAAPLRP
jgi:arsenate reductase